MSTTEVDAADQRGTESGREGRSMDALWRELVTVALLGTDRRDPPDVDGGIGDVVADTVRPSPSERMLALVAAVTAVRRAAIRPGVPLDPLAPPADDPRPPCRPAAVDRWHHIVASWPVLEDEWMIEIVRNGWRLAPELVPGVLLRHRSDGVRRARAVVAAGPLAPWLVGHRPDLAGRPPDPALDPAALLDLPALPTPPELASLLTASGAEAGRVIGAGLESGGFVTAHRAVLVNTVARVAPAALADLARVLDAVDPHAAGAGIAGALADLATTRRRMLDELAPPVGSGTGGDTPSVTSGR